MHGLEAEYFDRINFVYLDVDDSRNQEFKRSLGYKYQPHLFLVDGEGNIIKQWLGPVSTEEFKAAFDQALQ